MNWFHLVFLHLSTSLPGPWCCCIFETRCRLFELLAATRRCPMLQLLPRTSCKKRTQRNGCCWMEATTLYYTAVMALRMQIALRRGRICKTMQTGDSFLSRLFDFLVHWKFFFQRPLKSKQSNNYKPIQSHGSRKYHNAQTTLPRGTPQLRDRNDSAGIYDVHAQRTPTTTTTAMHARCVFKKGIFYHVFVLVALLHLHHFDIDVVVVLWSPWHTHVLLTASS